MMELDMSLTGQGTPLTRPLADAAHRRRNIPTGIEDHLRGASHPKGKPPLWVVDRILEPQMRANFISFLSSGHLPGGRKTSLPRLTAGELLKIVRPFSEWALPPQNHSNRSTVDWMGVRIGSYEDGARLVVISKELHSMKTRVWEGFAPLSERRWKELKLDEPQNFHAACQYLVAVTNVFHYLNHRVVKEICERRSISSGATSSHTRKPSTPCEAPPRPKAITNTFPSRASGMNSPAPTTSTSLPELTSG